jgi:hypothetical protein
LSDIIPSFFTKSDFWAILLPGYVTVILAMFFFFPNHIPGYASSTNNTQRISFEVFSVVVFIIAGPSVGFILWQIYFHISSLAFFAPRNTFNRKYEFQRVYGRLKIICSNMERAELDLLESRQIFGMSTAVGLFIIGLYALWVVFGLSYINHQSEYCKNPFIEPQSLMCKYPIRAIVIPIISIVVGFILAIGADLYNKRVRIPLICKMMQSHDLESTLTCRLRMNALDYHQKKKACKLIREFLREKYSPTKYKRNDDKPKTDMTPNELKKQLKQHLVDSNMFDPSIASHIIDILEDEKILILETGVQMINSSNKDEWIKNNSKREQWVDGKFNDKLKGGKVTEIKREDTVIDAIINLKNLKKNKSDLGIKARMRRTGQYIMNELRRKIPNIKM